MQFETLLQRVDDLMDEAIQSEVEVLTAASEHTLAAGGKRVRPQLMFLAYHALGGAEGDYDTAVRAAAAIELVHTATLVHDDINDHSVIRRGRESVHARWGRTFALLTGDFLFTKVYQLMAPLAELNVILSEAVVALVEGETLQAAAAKDGTLDKETYQQIIAKKTASLFRAAAMIGAKLADGSEEQVHKLGEFGFYMGLAFQIADDLLDLTGDPRLTGKPVGIDMAQGRGVGSMLEGGNGHSLHGEEMELVAEAPDDDPLLEIKRTLVAGGAVEEGHKMLSLIDAQARAMLDELPPGPAVEQLADLLTLVVERQS